MNIEELNYLHSQTKNEDVNFMVHGTWTGLSQGHTVNSYGFEQKKDAESYAKQLNAREGWQNEKEKYIVSEYSFSE